MEGKEDVEEIKIIKLILVHDAKLDALRQDIRSLSDKFDFFKLQIQEKESWIRKLVYLIIAVLGSIAGAGGLIKVILGIP